MRHDNSADRSPTLIALLVLFVGSGCSALIYEIVWFQLLQLVIGSSAVSLGILLGTFMGGMCLGSLLLPRLISSRHHPLMVYAILEVLIGGLGLALLYWLPFAGQMYISSAAHGGVSIAFRAIVCLVCLLPPAMLMGGTLPAIARWMEGTRVGISRLSFFYVANLFGAVIGCVLAGFYLLRTTDMKTATFVAVGINFAVAIIALLVARARAYAPDSQPREVTKTDSSNIAVYVTIALSGMTALAAEVIWTRLLSLLLGATVYTFSVILAVFLVGLGIGSSIGSYLAREVRDPRVALARCQLLVALAIAWSAYALMRSVPYWPISPDVHATPWTQYQFDIARCLWAMLPATCLWGASFPLALAAAQPQQRDNGKLVGGIYAANTVGAIVGAMAASFLLIGMLGTQLGQQVLIALAGCSALVMLLTCLKAPLETAFERREKTMLSVQIALLFPALAIAILLVPKIPPELVAAGRRLHEWRNDIPGISEDEKVEYLTVREGTNASIAVSKLSSGVRNFHVSGKVVASSESKDMRLQRMLAHIPGLLHKRPKSVLVVGCGAGVTAGSFLVHPDVERVVICEIEPLVPRTAGEYFSKENYDVMNDPRTEVVHDDARHFITTTKEKFDIITSDPIHPWVRGAAALYSQDYYELCQQKLNDGGIVTQWVPLYETSEKAAKSAVATFVAAFPHATVWGNDVGGEGYDIVMLGQKDKLQIDAQQLDARLRSEPYAEVKNSLREVQMGTTMEFLATFAAQRSDMSDWLIDAEINRDRNLRLQFLAGLSLNRYEAEAIYRNMVIARKYPTNIFKSASDLERSLRAIYALQIDRMLE